MNKIGRILMIIFQLLLLIAIIISALSFKTFNYAKDRARKIGDYTGLNR
jgi:cell division protein FtsL